MGEEQLLESLREQADGEIARLRAEAGERAGRVAAEAEREASAAAGAVLERARAEAEQARARILNAARLAARSCMLEAAHAFAAAVVGRTLELLRDLDGVSRAAALEGLLAECELPEGAVVRCGARDRPALERAAAARGSRPAFEEAELPAGGLEVLSDGGRRVQRNSFDARVEKAMPAIMREIALAFPEAAGDGGGA